MLYPEQCITIWETGLINHQVIRQQVNFNSFSPSAFLSKIIVTWIYTNPPHSASTCRNLRHRISNSWFTNDDCVRAMLHLKNFLHPLCRQYSSISLAVSISIPEDMPFPFYLGQANVSQTSAHLCSSARSKVSHHNCSCSVSPSSKLPLYIWYLTCIFQKQGIYPEGQISWTKELADGDICPKLHNQEGNSLRYPLMATLDKMLTCLIGFLDPKTYKQTP